MVDNLGILKVHVLRGRNLAVRDLISSDPFVKLCLDNQVVRSRVIARNVNPEWNEELTLLIPKPLHPLKVRVFDHDQLSSSDKLGDLELDLEPLVNAGKMLKHGMNQNSVIKTIECNPKNRFVRDSVIRVENGQLVQVVCANLDNIEKGQIELELYWTPNMVKEMPSAYTGDE